jgi:hypothetical protein
MGGNCIAEKTMVLQPTKFHHRPPVIPAETTDEEITKELSSYSVFIRSAAVAAVFYIVPHSSPLLTPSERALTNLTDFFGQVLFFNSTHTPKTIPSIKGLSAP